MEREMVTVLATASEKGSALLAVSAKTSALASIME
jgi:hypothetical protein